jgi:hypothetical protein
MFKFPPKKAAAATEPDSDDKGKKLQMIMKGLKK